MSKEIEPHVSNRFQNLKVEEEFWSWDDARENDPGEMIYETREISETFTDEQLRFIDSLLKDGEVPVCINLYTGYGCLSKITLKIRKDEDEFERLLFEDNLPKGGFRGIQFEENPESEADRRFRYYQSMVEKTKIADEEPFKLRKGFLKKEDLKILRAGTYGLHTGDIYGVYHYGPETLPRQTILLPLTVDILRRLPENDLTREIFARQERQISSGWAAGQVSFPEALEIAGLISHQIKKQGLKVRIADKHQISILMCTPEYPYDLLGFNDVASSTVEDNIVIYLNRHAGASLGRSGGPSWYSEKMERKGFQVIFEVVSKAERL